MVCVCVRERERERERVCVCVCVFVCVCSGITITACIDLRFDVQPQSDTEKVSACTLPFLVCTVTLNPD